MIPSAWRRCALAHHPTQPQRHRFGEISLLRERHSMKDGPAVAAATPPPFPTRSTTSIASPCDPVGPTLTQQTRLQTHGFYDSAAA